MKLQKFSIPIHNKLSDQIAREVLSVFPSKNLDNVYVKMVKNIHPPKWLSPIVKNVEDALECSLHRYWLNVMPTGSKIGWHKHDEDKDVAVLYVSIPDNESPIELKKDNEIITVDPFPGLLIKFPGSIEHRVNENKNKNYRISIAFDLL